MIKMAVRLLHVSNAAPSQEFYCGKVGLATRELGQRSQGFKAPAISYAFIVGLKAGASTNGSSDPHSAPAVGNFEPGPVV